MGKVPQSFLDYLKDRKPVVAAAAILLVSASIGAGLLFYFGLTLAAYGLGLAATGVLATLALGYLAKYAYDFANSKLPTISPPSYAAATNVGSEPFSSHHLGSSVAPTVDANKDGHPLRMMHKAAQQAILTTHRQDLALDPSANSKISLADIYCDYG